MELRCRIRYRMSKTEHRKRYCTFFKWTLLPAGPAPHPSAPPSDAGDNPPWNSDDERDFAEQAYSPPSPMSHYPGSLNQFLQFLSHIPDWNSFDKSALDHALQGLSVPIPGPAPRGISLQEAINVSPPPNRAACALLDRWKTRPHI